MTNRIAKVEQQFDEQMLLDFGNGWKVRFHTAISALLAAGLYMANGEGDPETLASCLLECCLDLRDYEAEWEVLGMTFDGTAEVAGATVTPQLIQNRLQLLQFAELNRNRIAAGLREQAKNSGKSLK
jgi:hypothetical protein